MLETHPCAYPDCPDFATQGLRYQGRVVWFCRDDLEDLLAPIRREGLSIVLRRLGLT